MLAVLSALGGALMYALASVLQQRGAASQPVEHSLRPGLLAALARNPGWVLGIVCDAAGFVLQFVALGHGPLVVVQPLLVCGLLFALPLGAWWAGRRLDWKGWVAALGVCAGLATFLAIASPAPGREDISPGRWAALLVAGGAATAVLAAWGRDRSRRHRAVLLSTSAGLAYGLAAALAKTTAYLLSAGLGALATHWQPYMLVVIGGGGMLLAQSAFQAGGLDASLPAMSVVDPLASILIGALAFGEAVNTEPAALGAEVAALAVMVLAVFALAHAEARRGVPGEAGLPAAGGVRRG